MPLASLALIAATTLGFGDISLLPSKGDRPFLAWQKSVASLDRPSERTDETLRRYDLARRYAKDAEGTIGALERVARQGPEPELVYALAELSWIEGLRADNARRRRGDAALHHYLDTVGYAFDYLFDPELAPGRSPTDPRFRLACDLYNAALDRLIRAAKPKGKLAPGDKIVLKLHGSERNLRLELYRETPWKAEDVHELIPASDFEVSGLDSRSRQYGLGVPLIAVRRSDPKANPDERFYPPEMAFPLTAILKPNRKLREAEDADEGRECTLDLVDPITVRSIGRAPEAIAIEADYTTPLAYMWSRTDFDRYRVTGLFRPGEAAERAGLMLLRPYEPGKIPVVMVHGLVSSPLAWIPMLNELLRDPRLHERYQFFLYVYPTGVPIPIAASGLRDALAQAQGQFDPHGASPEFRRMVLLGHSMGGLLSHAMAVDSQDNFWSINTFRRFSALAGPPDVLREIEHYTFFKAQPFVSRVVFLATPHRGSDYAKRMVGRIGASLVSEPDHYTKLLNQLVKANPNTFDAKRFRRLPTSIETLEPDSPVLLALLAMRPPPGSGVKFHSIIGTDRPVPLRESTDGVVPYRSSHFEGAETELVVESDHGVQKDPEAILEVKRILLEHLGIATAPAPPATAAEAAR